MARYLIKTVVDQIQTVGSDIKIFTIKHARGRNLPPFIAGANIEVQAGSPVARPYSLACDPGKLDTYRFAVLREAGGRGGSVSMHDDVHIGDELIIRAPVNSFALDENAKRHVFLAGGIGITPFVSMMAAVKAQSEPTDFRLVYAVRSKNRAAFAEELIATYGSERVRLHVDDGDLNNQLSLQGIVQQLADDDHLYACGPAPLLDAAKAVAGDQLGERLHFEDFVGVDAIDTSTSEPFEVYLTKSSQTITVAADETMLSALARHDIDCGASCQSGACGSCITGYLSGSPVHRDVCLSAKERDTKITPCVSRAVGMLELDI